MSWRVLAACWVLALASPVRAQDAGVPPGSETETETETETESESESESDDLFPEDEDALLTDEDLEIPDVIVTARAEPERRDETGGAVERLDEEELERFDYDDPNSVLGQVPAVYVRPEDGYGLRPNIGLRGVNADRSTRITLLEDGVLFAPAPYAAPAAYYFPLMSRMVGVDVYLGPATIPYGPRTVGGAIDLRTREIPYEPEGGLELALGTTWYGRTYAHYGASNAWGGFLVEGAYLHSDGFKTIELANGDDAGENSGFDRGEIIVRGQLHGALSSDAYHRLELRFGFGVEVSNETYLGLTDEDFRESPNRRYLASRLDRMEWWRTSVQLRHHLEVGDGFELRTVAYRQDFDRAWNKVNAIGSLPTETGSQDRQDLYDILTEPSGVNRVYVSILAGSEDTTGIGSDYVLIGENARVFAATGLQSEAIGRFETEPFEHRIRGGLRLHHDAVDRRHTEDAYAMIAGELERATETSYTTLSNHAEALALSAHLAWAVTWETLTLTPGVRAELIWSDFSEEGTGASSDFRAAVLPGGSIQWAIVPELSVFAGVMRGFAPVSPGQAANVAPEESTTYELGARLNSRGTATEGELTLFVNDYTNFLQQCSFSAGCADSASDVQENGGAAIIAGLDARIGQDIRFDGGAIPLRASYTFTYTELRSAIDRSAHPQYAGGQPGDHLPYVPEHQLTAQAGLELREFGINASASFVGEMWEAVGNGDETRPVLRTDAYFLLDATAYLQIFEGVRLIVRGENLTMTQAIVARRPFGARPNRPFLFQVGLDLAI